MILGLESGDGRRPCPESTIERRWRVVLEGLRFGAHAAREALDRKLLQVELELELRLEVVVLPSHFDVVLAPDGEVAFPLCLGELWSHFLGRVNDVHVELVVRISHLALRLFLL